jgi:flagellar basal-body rod protein FlgB
MYQNLSIFQAAGAMAKHAGARQAVVAQNVANADTPGYRAQTIAPFTEVFEKTGLGGMHGAAALKPRFRTLNLRLTETLSL